MMPADESSTAMLLGTATLVFLATFWLMPGGVLELRRRALGGLPVDLRPGYSPETLYALLRLYGSEGVRSFRRLLLADLVFPAVYGAFLFSLGDLAAAAHRGAVWIAVAIRVMALFTAGCDYAENIFLLVVLHALPQRRPAAVRAASLCTTLKMTGFALALAALAATWLSSQNR